MKTKEFPNLLEAGLKVGDKVYSYLYGDGVVKQIDKYPNYPISVDFGYYSEHFSKDGKRFKTDRIPSIHLEEWSPLSGEPLPFERNPKDFEPKVGEVYAFWDVPSRSFVVSVFKKIENGRYVDHNDIPWQNCAPISEAMKVFGFKSPTNSKDFYSLINRVEVWAKAKGIYDQSDAYKQASKALEEVGELIAHSYGGGREEVKDDIGDIIVCLINVAKFYDLDLYDCLEQAVETIEKRKGEMVNGKFVKED